MGGRITREAGTQIPSGMVFETAEEPLRVASELSLVPRLHDMLALAHEELLAMGITQVTNFEGADVRDAYARLHAEGRLRLRAHIGIDVFDLDEAIAQGVRTGDGDDRLTVGPVKLYSDGALGSHTAHLHEDFTGDPGNRGIAVTPFAELTVLVEKAVNAGIAVATHAIGDQANTLVLNAYTPIAEQAHRAGLQLRIEHSQHLQWEDVTRFAQLGVVASMQPIHCTSDYPLSVELLGERDIGHYPWRALIDAGVTVAFGSDAPVEPADPLFGVHAAVTRTRRDGDPEGGREPEQRVTVAEALRGFTREPAVAAGMGDHAGRLAPGYFADFIALDQDPFTIDPASIWQITVAATAVAGEIVFTRS
ncbi:putative amidohydrolase YtcJ [Leucobacter exalbidus]|uniref:Amidohydrolase YtcJ n=1 Tax=Leucobacter exalbidus TaxID=662960 RepID=A0A940T3N3_9MICO|nr:putative amidohydrolase YtcJ [Leucobacter exalbidus]